jgi:hypothetical protein
MIGLANRSRRAAWPALAVFTCFVSTASGTADVLRPDLVEAKLSNPPSSVVVGGRFRVTDRVTNRGRATARASTSVYYIVKAGDRTAAGFRAIPSLHAGKADAHAATVVIPAGARLGKYSLQACADVRHVVRESSKANNCRTAARTFLITKPKPPPV